MGNWFSSANGFSSAPSSSSANPCGSLRVAGSSSGSSYGHSSARSQSAGSGVSSVHQGGAFEIMLSDNVIYKNVFQVTSAYEVIIVYGKGFDLHWFLLVKLQGSKFSYITLEITTTDMTDLVKTTRSVDEECSDIWSRQHEKVGIYKGSLKSLCEQADQVVSEMQVYNLFTSNCQHFCNNLLKKIGLKTYPPTIGPETTLDREHRRFDMYTNVMKIAPAVIAHAGARAVGAAVGAPHMAHTSSENENTDHSE